MRLTIQTNFGASDSHQFKRRRKSLELFNETQSKVVADILEVNPHKSYDCSPKFTKRIRELAAQRDLALHGCRLIDFRNGHSIHSWELGIKGECTVDEIAFMNALIKNRRKKTFGSHQDGKSLSLAQIKTFFDHVEIEKISQSLIEKKYLRFRDGLFNPVSGNMSFEVFKFLDPESISITLVTSDAHKLGIAQGNRVRRITPRECARIQGFPEEFQVNPSDLHAYRQFGNSVSVPVVTAVIKDLFTHNAQHLGISLK